MIAWAVDIIAAKQFTFSEKRKENREEDNIYHSLICSMISFLETCVEFHKRSYTIFFNEKKSSLLLVMHCRKHVLTWFNEIFIYRIKSTRLCTFLLSNSRYLSYKIWLIIFRGGARNSTHSDVSDESGSHLGLGLDVT